LTKQINRTAQRDQYQMSCPLTQRSTSRLSYRLQFRLKIAWQKSCLSCFAHASWCKKHYVEHFLNESTVASSAASKRSLVAALKIPVIVIGLVSAKATAIFVTTEETPCRPQNSTTLTTCPSRTSF